MTTRIIQHAALALTCICLCAAEKTAKKSDPTEEFFASTNVLRIRIEIPPEGIERLSKYQFQFGQQSERESVNATVREGNNVYTNVSLHLKGAAGSFRPITDNPAMTLNFDKNVANQRFHGLEKISLNNSVQDPTLVSEQLSRELFLKAGVPAARASHAVVELNGRPLGVYVLVEGFNKQFLKRHFKKSGGNLYDGGFLKDINADLALNSGKENDQSDRQRLLEAVQEPDIAKRVSRLEEVLDLDRFLTYVALDVMLWDWDGYSQNRNNWRLYHDPGTGKMTFIPHGLDQMFWKPEGSILPQMQGMVSKAVLQAPELRARYFRKINELRASVFQPEAMTNRVRAIAAKVQPILAREDKEKAAEQERALTKFCDAIIRRTRSIDEQLANPIAPVKFDATGTFTLAKWESKKDFGRPNLQKEGDTLRIAAADGSSIGTWNSKIWLEAGRYRVEGRMKTSGIVGDLGDSRPGAGVRFGRKRPGKYESDSTDWKQIEQDFTVDDAMLEVPVIVEFRGAAGEASFDSLKVRRLK